jgi:hypothetical protein
VKSWTGFGVVLYKRGIPFQSMMLPSLAQARTYAHSCLMSGYERIEIDRWHLSLIIEPNVIVLEA